MKDKELPLILGYFEHMTHRNPIEIFFFFFFFFGQGKFLIVYKGEY